MENRRKRVPVLRGDLPIALSHLRLLQSLYPPDGIDWVAAVSDAEIEQRFRSRVEPLLHPDFELIWTDPDSGSRRSAGRVAYEAALRQSLGQFESFCITPKLFVELENQVLVLVHREIRSGTGPAATNDGAALFTIEEERIRTVELFVERDAGLAAAGVTYEEARRRGVPPSSRD